ncbi:MULTISPECIES: glycosyl hydrolase family 18 protein [Oscillospiraceae]|uniref:glycosyl hydrolase family 18 protein n=1 Tax=Oscillospiraceae TaxID=216572 RepID=UPI001FAA693A|nr:MULTISPECIES: glycosyl hydrolase family 18 protein [Oscillospiraceae]
MDERRGKRRPDGRPARKRQRPVQQQDPRRRNQESRRQKEFEMRRQIRRRKKRRKRILILLLLLLIAVIAAGIVLWIRYGPSREEADKNEYFGITDTSQVGLAIDNQIPDVKSMKEGSEVYLDFDSVHDYVNQRFYWDSNENRLLYTLPDRTLSIPAGSTEFESEDGTQTRDYEIVKVENDTVYLALDFVKEYTDMSLDVYENPDRAVIVTNKEENHARVSKDTEVRILGGVKSPILTEISKSDDVVVIEEAGSWMKVRTVDGYIGYVKSNTLEKAEKQTRKSEYEEPEYTNIQKDYKINLAWHQVTSQAANENVASVIAGTTGLTTISPTWFTIQDTNGNITSLASSAYVDAAHQAGLEVWGLVDNFTNQVDTLTVLSNTQSRANMISQLITEAQNSGLDGINVDFEQITEEMSDHYIQFIRELSVECRKNQIVLSVDNYVPGFTSHYNREEQGIVADYVIIMGYDEHFAGSEEAGSVASIDFVREGITETLKEVPKEKVINGLPFFTRLWIESSSGLTSQAIGMQEAETAVANAGVTASWDEETQQNYAEWTADGNTYKIWLEDEQSLEAKLKVMQEYDLAGAAAWKLGFEKSGIWELISRYVNG